MDETLKVDARALQARNAKLARGFDNLPLWFVRWFGESLLFAAFLILGIPAVADGRLPGLHGLASPSGIGRLAVIVALAVLGTTLRYRNTRALLSAEPSLLEEQANQNWRYVAGQGWLVRTLATGLLFTLVGGLLIGLLLAFDTPISELPGQSRALMVLAFTGMTAAWAFPAAFLMRWALVRSLRKLTTQNPMPTSASTT